MPKKSQILLHLTSFLICRFAKQSWILQFSLLSFVQGLICKWTSAQEPRLVLGYKSLIKTALGLGLVKLKLGWICQEKLSLNNKKSVLCPVNRYNGSIIVTTIHETYNDLINRYNVSAQLIQRLYGRTTDKFLWQSYRLNINPL
jgi:hypothetical protein